MAGYQKIRTEKTNEQIQRLISPVQSLPIKYYSLSVSKFQTI
jgi:hypothetical protein